MQGLLNTRIIWYDEQYSAIIVVTLSGRTYLQLVYTPQDATGTNTTFCNVATIIFSCSKWWYILDISHDSIHTGGYIINNNKTAEPRRWEEGNFSLSPNLTERIWKGA